VVEPVFETYTEPWGDIDQALNSADLSKATEDGDSSQISANPEWAESVPRDTWSENPVAEQPRTFEAHTTQIVADIGSTRPVQQDTWNDSPTAERLQHQKAMTAVQNDTENKVLKRTPMQTSSHNQSASPPSQPHGLAWYAGGPRIRPQEPRHRRAPSRLLSTFLGNEYSDPDPQRWQPVGLPIPWDASTKSGQWLLARDAWIRLGHFDIPGSEYLFNLHRAFPYDARIPRWKLEEMNVMLRSLSSMSIDAQRHSVHIWAEYHSARLGDKSTFTQPDSVQWKPIVNAAQYGITSWPQYCSDQQVSLPRATNDLHPLGHQSTPPEDSAIPFEKASTEEMPDSDFIRSRRLAYFALTEQRESVASTSLCKPRRGSDANLTNVTTLMRSAGIASTSFDRPRALSGPSEPLQSMRGRREEDPAAAVNIEVCPEAAFDPRNEDSPRDSTVDEGGSFSNQLVPATLCPDLSTSERPRDEDPRVMPIPRSQGFEFDVRHLRDLAVIKEGGNACAAEGFEFEVDEDDHWTGAEAVDLQASLGNGTSEELSGLRPDYVYGKGDEEGLLDELPGPDL
jgi:hypothetical protein